MSVETPRAERPPGLGRVLADARDELARRPSLPPGPTSFSPRRTHRFQRHTLATTLHYRELFGDVYTVRMFHRLTVVMLGPEANHFVTVTGADNFSWRRGMFGEHLIPLIGDGLITTDGEYHDRARKIMMPAFHRERMDASVAIMQAEAGRALDPWRAGATVDVYHWMRDLSMGIAMRALVGLEGGRGHEAAEAFERALSFYDTETFLMLLRGPGSPWWRLQRARRELDRIVYAEIASRRARGGGGEDALSMLLDARDEDGEGFTDRELRDQTMHLLFGGHDTASSTLSFLVYELARHPEVAARLRAEQDRVLGGRAPTVDELLGELPELTMAMDETLRLYPPVWFGPRMSVRDFEFQGHAVPAGTHIMHSSWSSHRLPDVFPEPEEFRPERFTPEARAALPKGAYIPFGGGRRICIGKRFGQLVVKAVATSLLQRFDFALAPGYQLTVDKLPTLSPRGGLPVVLSPRP
jgi:cytochrome P450